MRHAVISVRRFGTMFCMALAVLLAANSLSFGVDRLQHGTVSSSDHEHLAIGNVTISSEHIDDHHEVLEDEGAPTRAVGGHHHHGDSGWGALPQGTTYPSSFALTGDQYILPHDRSPRRSAVSGPERPPKFPTMHA